MVSPHWCSEDRDALARTLYAMFGRDLYGQDIGPWDSHRVEAEHHRWLKKADYLIRADQR